MKKILTLCVSVVLSLSFLVPFISFNSLVVDAAVSGSEIVFDDLSGFSCDQLNAFVDKVLNVYDFANPVLSYSGDYLQYHDAVYYPGGSDGNMYYHNRVLFKLSDFSIIEQFNPISWSNIPIAVTNFLFCDYTGTVKTKEGVTITNLNEVTQSDFLFSLDDKCSIKFYNVNILPGPNGTVSPIIQDTFVQGTSISVEAIPNPNYYFSGWSDGNYDNPRTFVVNSDINVVATFLELPKYKVNVEIFGNGSVTGTGEYYEGTEVMLSAIPDEGYYFESWNDGSIDPAKFITVENDVTFAATFKQKSTAACTYSKDLVANPYVLKGVDRAIKLVESNQAEDYWWIAKRFYNFILDIDGGYVPSGTAFVQPQSIEWVLAYHVNDELIYESLGFEMNVPGYYSFVHTSYDGSLKYYTFELIVGNTPGFEYVDSSGNAVSFDLISRYDQIELLDSYCWKQGYDSNYYDLLQYYELKNANSNLVNNNNELTDINDNLSLIDRGIVGITNIIDSIPAKLSIISENVLSIFHKLDHVISGLFGVQYAVEDLIDSNDQQSQLIDSGTNVSQSVADKNDNVSSELTDSITQHNQIEQEYQAQMQQHISNVDFNLDLNGVSNFTSTAAFISGQMDLFYNLDPAITMMFTFPLICGLAMLIIGRLRQ